MTAIRNVLAGIGGGGLVGAILWGTARFFDINQLLMWIIAGAVTGSLGTIGCQLLKGRHTTDTGESAVAECEPVDDTVQGVPQLQGRIERSLDNILGVLLGTDTIASGIVLLTLVQNWSIYLRLAAFLVLAVVGVVVASCYLALLVSEFWPSRTFIPLKRLPQ